MKSLTICIPTYNRVLLLKESLYSIIRAIEFAKIEVKIIISDNFSTDNTKDFCINLIIQYPYISYYRNNENFNELNFYLAVEKSKSDYIWLFSDDDIMNLNSIKLVNDAIILGYNIIIANYDLYNNELDIIKKRNYFNIKDNLKYNNKNNLLVDYNLKLGFISCVIFERKAFLCMPLEVFDKYRPYGFPFVYGIYSSLKENIQAIIISEALLIQRGANSPADINWWYKCFVEGSSKIFNELLKFGYNKYAIKMAKKNVFSEYVISDLLWRKRNGKNTLEAISYLYKYYKIFPTNFIYSICIIMTPSIIIKFLYHIKQKLFQ